MIFGVAEIVSFVSQFVTLEPGDLIFTGTPGKTRGISPGDTIEVEIEGIGTLKNTVAR
jgi:2-keto-4-pentenoate hydratase/2-oxohepta-3-ene-1,7-dioic acid hydratase in catechol pathway